MPSRYVDQIRSRARQEKGGRGVLFYLALGRKCRGFDLVARFPLYFIFGGRLNVADVTCHTGEVNHWREEPGRVFLVCMEYWYWCDGYA